MKKLAGIFLLALMMVLATACSSSSGGSADNSGSSEGGSDNGSSEQASGGDTWKPSKDIEVVVPSSAGGGWDTTARMTFKYLKQEGLLKQDYGVINKEGGGGAIGWAYVHSKKGDNHELFVTSPPILLVPLTGHSQYNYKDFTPIANIITDFGAFAVSKDSKFDSAKELFAAMKKDPTSITVVGASSPGSLDHLQFMKAAKAAGVDITKIKYVSDADGALTGLLNGSYDVFSTGLAEMTEQAKAGKVKVLAVTSEKRLTGDVVKNFPTLKEQGIDATFLNWRGFFGPPDMDPAAVKFYEQQLKKLSESDEWTKVRNKYGWKDRFIGHDDYLKFLKEKNAEYKELLDELGLTK